MSPKGYPPDAGPMERATFVGVAVTRQVEAMPVDPSLGSFLLERLATEPRDMQIVALLMAAMKEAQGQPPVVPDPPRAPKSALPPSN